MLLPRSTASAKLLCYRAWRRNMWVCDMETHLASAVLGWAGCSTVPLRWKFISWGETFCIIHDLFWHLPYNRTWVCHQNNYRPFWHLVIINSINQSKFMKSTSVDWTTIFMMANQAQLFTLLSLEMYHFGSPGGLGLQLYATAFTASRLSNDYLFFLLVLYWQLLIKRHNLFAECLRKKTHPIQSKGCWLHTPDINV